MVDDPAHYGWKRHRHNALGQITRYLTPLAVYLPLGREVNERRATYRGLFRALLVRECINDMRLTLNQNQPLGNARFYAEIEAVTGQRRETRPRARRGGSDAHDPGQAELAV